MATAADRFPPSATDGLTCCPSQAGTTRLYVEPPYHFPCDVDDRQEPQPMATAADRFPPSATDGLTCCPSQAGTTRVDRFLSSCPGAIQEKESSANHEYAGLYAANSKSDSTRTRGIESKTFIRLSRHLRQQLIPHIRSQNVLTLASPLPPLVG
eukprot:CAMPEP_0194066834 /NCGR_PEP_ID=MMETSP0009_2-20130614/86235_1 /TAXON_ID=210454 /ORGANISM="Grammatophora oceanica, Strain CCMP 410" /LENGTH=153 /DNA_ID=CAMNT_0038719823 /DNA_START=1792 /DNA_END=2253 /DNA_ORIENTATION=-